MKNDVKVAYLFIAPAVIVIVGIVAYPFIKAIILSLTKHYIGSGFQGFVGFENYNSLLSDFMFRRAFKNTLIWTFFSAVIKLFLGMQLALLFNRKFKGDILFRSIMLIPWIIPIPISALVWTWIFSDFVGILNYILQSMNLIEFPIAWLGTKYTALPSVLAVNIWRGIPFFGLTLFAGLKSIPVESYEVAKIEGANKLQTFLYITLPGLRHVIIVSTLLESIWAMGDFSIVFIMTRGGPGGATHLLSTYTYELAFLVGDLGQAVAVSLFALPLLAGLIVLAGRYMKRSYA